VGVVGCVGYRNPAAVAVVEAVVAGVGRVPTLRFSQAAVVVVGVAYVVARKVAHVIVVGVAVVVIAVTVFRGCVRPHNSCRAAAGVGVVVRKGFRGQIVGHLGILVVGSIASH